jgi:hypothetical protein
MCEKLSIKPRWPDPMARMQTADPRLRQAGLAMRPGCNVTNKKLTNSSDTKAKTKTTALNTKAKTNATAPRTKNEQQF